MARIVHDNPMTRKVFALSAAAFLVLMVGYVLYFTITQAASNERVIGEAEVAVASELVTNGVGFGEWEWIGDRFDGRMIRGSVRNEGAEALPFVSVQFRLEDAEAGPVGGAEETVWNLAPGEEREVEIAVWNPRVEKASLTCIMTPASPMDPATGRALCSSLPPAAPADPATDSTATAATDTTGVN